MAGDAALSYGQRGFGNAGTGTMSTGAGCNGHSALSHRGGRFGEDLRQLLADGSDEAGSASNALDHAESLTLASFSLSLPILRGASAAPSYAERWPVPEPSDATTVD